MWELSCSAAPNLPPACIAGSPGPDEIGRIAAAPERITEAPGNRPSPRKVFRNLNRRLPLAPPSTPPETLRPHPVKIWSHRLADSCFAIASTMHPAWR
jgi:hypothetical protein